MLSSIGDESTNCAKEKVCDICKKETKIYMIINGINCCQKKECIDEAMKKAFIPIYKIIKEI